MSKSDSIIEVPLSKLRLVEGWRDIPGYEGYYKVSTLGRVKSLPRIVPMCDGRVYRVSGKILDLKIGYNEPYFRVSLSKNRSEKLFTVHSLVLTAFRGPRPGKGMVCRHLDGNSRNNRLSNLQWGTYSENMADSDRHGTSIKALKSRQGIKHPMVKLTEKDVIYIRNQMELGRSRFELANKFRVTETTIRDVYHRRSWKHI